MDPQIGKVTNGLRPLTFHSARFVVSTIEWRFRGTICNCHLRRRAQMSKASTCLSVLTNWISNREKRPFR